MIERHPSRCTRGVTRGIGDDAGDASAFCPLDPFRRRRQAKAVEQPRVSKDSSTADTVARAGAPGPTRQGEGASGAASPGLGKGGPTWAAPQRLATVRGAVPVCPRPPRGPPRPLFWFSWRILFFFERLRIFFRFLAFAPGLAHCWARAPCLWIGDRRGLASCPSPRSEKNAWAPLWRRLVHSSKSSSTRKFYMHEYMHDEVLNEIYFQNLFTYGAIFAMNLMSLINI